MNNIINNGQNYIKNNDKITKEILKHPWKLRKQKQIIKNCDICFNKTKKLLENNEFKELENPEQYCLSCRNKIEELWK